MRIELKGKGPKKYKMERIFLNASLVVKLRLTNTGELLTEKREV